MMNHDHDHNDHIDHDDHAASQVEEFLAAGCIKRGLSPVEHFIRFLNIFVICLNISYFAGSKREKRCQT